MMMGAHGHDQPQVYEEVDKKLERHYRPNGIRVFYCDQDYKAANDAFDQYLAQHGYPPGLHGYLYDTSQMMYLDKDNTGCGEIWSPLQWEIPSSMARCRSGRRVHKMESWVTRAAQRRSWGSA